MTRFDQQSLTFSGPTAMGGRAPTAAEWDALQRENSQLRQRLQYWESVWKAVSDDSLQYITLIDRDLRILSLNCVVEGWNEQDLIGQRIPELVPEKVRAGWEQLLDSAFSTGTSKPYELEAYGALHRTAWYRGVVSPIIVPGEARIEHALVMSIDETQHRLALSELEARQAELAHISRLSTLGAMAAEMAHELNQPLSAIANFARGCTLRNKSGELSSTTLEEILQEINTQANRAGSIIRSTRAFLRKQDCLRTMTSINELVTRILPVARIQTNRAGIAIRLELADNLEDLLMDEVQIEQVILNLTLNALEAMHETPAGEGEIVIRTVRNGSTDVQLSVVDQGRGLTHETAPRMFEAFFTTKPQGLGMGLSISRTIIENHGGRIWAAPNFQRGTTVAFLLPIPG